MSSFSKTIVCGNLGQDPELRYAGNGNAVVNISIATSERYKDKDGNQQERTEWHRVVFFGKPAEVISEHCRKGSKLLVEGQNRTRKYTDGQGVEKYSTEIVGRDFTFMGKAPGQENNGGGYQSAPPNAQQQRPAAAPAQQQAQQQPAGNFDDFDDDIPF